jgi:hypothetical protein
MVRSGWREITVRSPENNQHPQNFMARVMPDLYNQLTSSCQALRPINSKE